MPAPKVITIPNPDIREMVVKIKGTSPLIFHKWSEKAKKMILAKQQKKASASKREIRNPEEEYESSFYYNRSKKVSFPALAIKQSLIGACRNVDGLPMTLVRGAIFVMGDEDGLIPVEYKEKEMREDMVRVGMGTADLRYRGQVKGWNMKFLVKWNNDVLSQEQVLNLFQIAGFSNGLGEWRPEKSGDFGTFELDMEGSK